MKTLLSDHERCQEKAERGSHSVSGLWIEVTIIPVVRLEIVHLEKSLWRGRTLVSERRSRMWTDRILLCGGRKHQFALACSGYSCGLRGTAYGKSQAARFPSPLQLIHEDEDMSFEEPRMSEWSGGSCMSFLSHIHDWYCTVQHDQEGKSTMAVNQSSSPESDMQLLVEANKRMLMEEIATDVTFLVR